MKIKILFLALFVAGVTASMAIADDGHGRGDKGNDHAGRTPTAASATPSTSDDDSDGDHGGKKDKGAKADAGAKKLLMCHRAGKSGRWVLVLVSRNSSHASGKHGDVPAVGGACPGTTGTSTTTVGTTTVGTTTAHTTTAGTTTAGTTTVGTTTVGTTTVGTTTAGTTTVGTTTVRTTTAP